MSNMQGCDTDNQWALETGQLWKLDEGYVCIMQLSQRTVLYKILKVPDQKSALTRLMSIDALLKRLRENHASLITSPPEEANPSQP